MANLYFRNYGELYVVDIDNVMYFKADDHYTHVYYASGAHFMMPYGLSKVEQVVQASAVDSQHFLRLGRTHIVNASFISYVNANRQEVIVTDSHGENHSIQLPKGLLHELMDNIERIRPIRRK